MSLQNSLILITFEGRATSLGATPSFCTGLIEVRVAKLLEVELWMVVKVVALEVAALEVGLTVVLVVVLTVIPTF